MQIHTSVKPEGKLLTGNDVISYFRSAAHHVHATTAVFTITKLSFWKISENTKASIFKIHHCVALYSFYIWTGNDVIIYFQSAANRINVLIFDHVLVEISRLWFSRFHKGLQFWKW